MGRTMRRCGRRVAAGLMLLAALGTLLDARAVEAQGPVKVGFIYPDVGPLAQLGINMRDGFLLYWSQVGGKAGGRAVELLPEGKGSNKPDEGLTKARKLVERDRVHMVAGVISTPVALAVRPYLVEKKMPTIMTISGAVALTQKLRNEYIFRTSFANTSLGYPLGEWAYKQGYRKAVIMSSDFGGPIEQIGGFAHTFTAAGGEVIQELYPPLGALDFAPYLNQIRRDADLVSVFFGGADAIRFVTQYTEFGLREKTPLIGLGWLTDEDILHQIGDKALGIVTSLHWSAALDSPVTKRFLDAYASRYRRPANVFAEAGYVGAQVIAQALEAVKGNVEDKQAFLAALGRAEASAPRGKIKIDAWHDPIQSVYIRKVEKKDGVLQNTVILSYPNTTQFWKWTPEALMAMPGYIEMRGKWAK